MLINSVSNIIPRPHPFDVCRPVRSLSFIQLLNFADRVRGDLLNTGAIPKSFRKVLPPCRRIRNVRSKQSIKQRGDGSISLIENKSFPFSSQSQLRASLMHPLAFLCLGSFRCSDLGHTAQIFRAQTLPNRIASRPHPVAPRTNSI